MPKSQPYYDDDLAYIHNVGFGGFAEGSSPGLLEIFGKAGIDDGLIVDLGCGGGIWAERLVQAGYQVVGVDFSKSMTAIASQRVPSAEFHTQSLWDFPLPPCRAVTALGEVVCYLADQKAKSNFRSLFRKVFRSLEPGGLFIFDIAEIGLGRGRQPTFFEGDDWSCLVRLEYDQRRDQLHRHITTYRKLDELYRRAYEVNIVQLYDARQVATLLRDAGFRVRTVRKYGDYPLLEKRVGFIARKP